MLKWFDYRCAQCGESGAASSLEIDHIVPLAKGGGNHLLNMQVLCRACNSAKSDNISYES